ASRRRVSRLLQPSPRPPCPTRFPYTTLFRSPGPCPARAGDGHGALPPLARRHSADRGLHGEAAHLPRRGGRKALRPGDLRRADQDRKSTRLNSSHVKISYAVFCLKKKKVR